MDRVVKSWIFGTISTDLAESALDRKDTARVAWLALETQFLGNWETRALYLDVDFRNHVQGDLTIADYYRQIKTMAQQLVDLGEPVSDRTLVLNVIRGLNERFRDIGRHLRRSHPFPTFKEALAELTLEELTMEHHASAPSTALLVATGKAASGTSSSSRPRQQQQPSRGKASGSRDSNSGGGKRKSRDSKDSQESPQQVRWQAAVH